MTLAEVITAITGLFDTLDLAVFVAAGVVIGGTVYVARRLAKGLR